MVDAPNIIGWTWLSTWMVISPWSLFFCVSGKSEFPHASIINFSCCLLVYPIRHFAIFENDQPQKHENIKRDRMSAGSWLCTVERILLQAPQAISIFKKTCYEKLGIFILYDFLIYIWSKRAWGGGSPQTQDKSVLRRWIRNGSPKVSFSRIEHLGKVWRSWCFIGYVSWF